MAPNIVSRAHNSEHSCLRHAQSGYRFQIGSSYTCGRGFFFLKGEKKLGFQTNTDTSGRGHREDSLLHARVVVKTSNLVISRRRYAEDSKNVC